MFHLEKGIFFNTSVCTVNNFILIRYNLLMWNFNYNWIITFKMQYYFYSVFVFNTYVENR